MHHILKVLVEFGMRQEVWIVLIRVIFGSRDCSQVPCYSESVNLSLAPLPCPFPVEKSHY